jgi:arginyl-tRNA synthetase
MSVAIRSSLAKAVQAAFSSLELTIPETVELERPARPEHGDWSSNVALKTSKALGRNPREVATLLAGFLNVNLPKHVTAVEIAGPGFLNFRLVDSWLHDVIIEVLAEGTENYARLSLPEARSVVVEYVSANPTGPLHAGHARWAAYGDALSRVLSRAGYAVHREFYINDRGVQMEKFGMSLAARKAGTDVPEGGYVGQYIRDWAAVMPDGVDPLAWGYARALEYQKSTLKRMHVEFDSWSSEKAIADSGAVEATLADLRASGHVYEASGNNSFVEGAPVAGISGSTAGTEPGKQTLSGDGAQSDTATSHDAAAQGEVSGHVAIGDQDEDAADSDDAAVPASGSATWLRTTSFGDKKLKQLVDDRDRVLVKADGAYTYFMPDIAYHRDKFKRGSLLIDILGADHHGYVARMTAAVQALGHPREDLEILIGQFCILMRAGVEVRLSKRTGDILELAEILDEVGPDVAKLTFLLQSIDTKQTVDLDDLVNSSLDNPVHYIHYAHARVYGIGRKAAELGITRKPLADVDLSVLSDTHELDVVRLLADLPEVLTLAARERAPHKITTWVRELAASFQAFYAHCPVLRSDTPEDVRQARFWLVEAARIGLAIGLDLLGVSAPEQLDKLDTEADVTTTVTA